MPQPKTVISQDVVPLAVAPDNDFFQPGEALDDLIILKELGRGATATVYLGRQTTLNRDIALKVSRESYSEGRTLAQLDHPNIVRVYSDSWDTGRQVRLTSVQYIDGVPLGTFLADPALIRPEAWKSRSRLGVVIWISHQLAQALEHAHTKGIIHLDIKPQNILLSAAGVPYLADFNVSNQQGTLASGNFSTFGGTPEYMSPEQKRVLATENPQQAIQKVTAASDIYSLGLVIQEMMVWLLPKAYAPAAHDDTQVHLAYFHSILKSMVAEEPEQRPTAAQLIHLFKANGDYLQFHERMGAAAVLPWKRVFAFVLGPMVVATVLHLISILNYSLLSVRDVRGSVLALCVATPLLYWFVIRYLRAILQRLREIPQRKLNKEHLTKLRKRVIHLPLIATGMVFTLVILGFRAYNSTLPLASMHPIAMVAMILAVPVSLLVLGITYSKTSEWVLVTGMPLLGLAEDNVTEMFKREGERVQRSIEGGRRILVFLPLFFLVVMILGRRYDFDLGVVAMLRFRQIILIFLTGYQIASADYAGQLLERVRRAIEPA